MRVGRLVGGAALMRAFGFIVFMIIAIPVAWVGGAFVYETLNTYSHRFRLTIEVDTPEGVKAASSVIQATHTGKATGLPQTGGTYSSVRGEAVFVELGNNRHVIAVLAFGPHAGQDQIDQLAADAFGRNRAFWYKEAPSWTGRAELTGDLIPTLVTFTDLNDPTTAQVVRPDAFESVFGPGVRFKRAWIEITGDPVTRGIEKKLPWLLHVERYRTDPSNPFTNMLPFGRTRFIREL
jgi:hypothetical protein